MTFTTDYQKIINLLEAYDPSRYTASRNYIDGTVSRLSPYISRGVISTRDVMKSLVIKGVDLRRIEKFIQELAWRDYWQRVWQVKDVNLDIKHPQPHFLHTDIPNAITDTNTGIEALDKGINELNNIGYIHNHMRMYLAMLICNIGKSHWMTPARWMYYDLLDADWASNALSWQWVAGANSNKLYIANQENINKYTHSDQTKTYLDTSYEELMGINVPKELKEISTLSLTTSLPKTGLVTINPDQPVLIYNFYNLDPKWHQGLDANRILLLEPSVFEKYPVSDRSIQFTLDLADNIPNIQIFTGEFNDLKRMLKPNQEIRFKEHPLNQYEGIEEPRDWMTSVSGYFPSFFSFWKKAKRELFGKANV
ncbi:FAD-binding domain-containing protein [Reichenbachiella versicolor]|uniref:FAD-binding domain-containing protein n=1 Tax=Reichenbachiella versicolor TaxID=1821036 RepID=UPI000D6E803E|nr:FAD-binding domain-containing protein [Reichenbachiella versicolor]